MPDPFRGEVCAAWLDYLAELDPDVLQEVMHAVAEGVAWTEQGRAVLDRTREVYLPDLSYANSRAHHPALQHQRFTIAHRNHSAPVRTRTMNQGAL